MGNILRKVTFFFAYRHFCHKCREMLWNGLFSSFTLRQSSLLKQYKWCPVHTGHASDPVTSWFTFSLLCLRYYFGFKHFCALRCVQWVPFLEFPQQKRWTKQTIVARFLSLLGAPVPWSVFSCYKHTTPTSLSCQGNVGSWVDMHNHNNILFFFFLRHWF